MENTNLSLLSIKLCSPIVIFIVYVIISLVSLFMTRSILKRYNNQRMDNLYNLYSWNEVKLTIIIGVVIYGLCQYDHVSLAWIFLFCPIIYVMLNNLFSYAYVSLAHQNAPKESSDSESDGGLLSNFTNGGGIYPETPTVKKEVNTSIFGMRGDPTVEGNSNIQEKSPSPPPPPVPTPPIEQEQSPSPQQSTQLSSLDQQFSGSLTGDSWGY